MNMFKPFQLKDIILVFGIERDNANGPGLGVEGQIGKTGLFLVRDQEVVAVG
jgi:hypothetical protein